MQQVNSIMDFEVNVHFSLFNHLFLMHSYGLHTSSSCPRIKWEDYKKRRQRGRVVSWSDSESGVEGSSSALSTLWICSLFSEFKSLATFVNQSQLAASCQLSFFYI